MCFFGFLKDEVAKRQAAKATHTRLMQRLKRERDASNKAHQKALQVMKNFEFFGAPCALFCFVDRQMGPPQWSDLGMFLQTFMLLAKEAGLDTCAQEAWSMKHDSVSKFVKADDTDILFCGMAIGYRDDTALVNSLKSERRPLKEWAKFL